MVSVRLERLECSVHHLAKYFKHCQKYLTAWMKGVTNTWGIFEENSACNLQTEI